MVRGQKSRLREVFGNLLSNAAKFIDRRPGSLVVSSTSHDGLCEIVVADNGPGIPAEDRERVFVPFRRLGMHRHCPGSGLGLYFTKNLVMQLGGRIWITSEPGEGSQIHIELHSAGKAES
jgi:signal transduction histidine kinase